MKVLWMSDSPTSPSGFGNVTRFVCAHLGSRGHQVSILGWQAQGEPTRWQDCTLYPVRFDRFGADVLLTYLYRIRPDVLITLADVWWLTYIASPGIANFLRTAGIPWVHYYPIDGDMGDGRLPPSWVHILRSVDLPVAMSKYGRDVSEANGVRPSYVPHGVESAVFRPALDKAAAKRAMGYQGRFVVLSDARNQPRKMLPRLLDIFARFATGKPDVALHLHCDPQDPAARSPEYTYELLADIAFLGLSDKVRITAGMSIMKGVPLGQLAAIYQAADVHLLTSWGEGFGLPTLQAAAAGVVPMASDYTASRELTAGHGEPIRVRDFIPDEFGIRRALIDTDDAVEKLERLYRDPALLAHKSEVSARFAEAYDWNRVVDTWEDLLRQEMPRARQHLARSVATSRVTLGTDGDQHATLLGRAVQRAVPGLPDGAQVTVNVSESRPGELVAELFRDATRLDRRLTIPVTLPAANPLGGKSRITGLVYLAGPRDAEVFRLLATIFPAITAWSTLPLDVGCDPETGGPRKLAVVSGETRIREALERSTLSLDLELRDPAFEALTAKYGVPSITSGTVGPEWCGPDGNDSDATRAARLCRAILTDQGFAAAACRRAAECLPVHRGQQERRIC